MLNSNEKIVKSEELFRLLVERVKDYAIFILNPDGLVVSWNLGAERIKGYKEKEIIGKHFSVFYTKEDIGRGHPAYELKQARELGKYDEEGWRVKKDGTHFLASVLITALYDNSGQLQGFSKITKDITEQKEAERLRLKSVKEQAELIEAKRNIQIREDFLSIASHELKTPLTPLNVQMQTLTRLAEKKTFDSVSMANLQSIFKTCTRQIEQLTTLIDSLLDFSRIDGGRMIMVKAECDLTQLILEVVSPFKKQLETVDRPIEVTIKENIKGNWDKFRIGQVILNLLVNAIKYGENKPIKISVERIDDRAVFSVRDFGMGVDKRDFKRIFKKFERAVSVNRIGGLGLGLFIAQEIIDAHDGKISVTSELHKGSLFTVELPL